VKATRKRQQRTQRTRPATSGPAAPASAMKIPSQARPVMRGIARDPINVAIAASVAGCAQCFGACRAHGGPLQSVCESLCASVCNP